MRIMNYDKLEKQIKEAEKEALQNFDYSTYFMIGLMKTIIESAPIFDTEIFYNGLVLDSRLEANIPIDPVKEMREYLYEVKETLEAMEE